MPTLGLSRLPHALILVNAVLAQSSAVPKYSFRGTQDEVTAGATDRSFHSLQRGRMPILTHLEEPNFS